MDIAEKWVITLVLNFKKCTLIALGLRHQSFLGAHMSNGIFLETVSKWLPLQSADCNCIIPYSGFLGSDASSSINSLNFAAIESENKPMFLYGERKVSRRSGKFRRIQSAIVKGKIITDLLS